MKTPDVNRGDVGIDMLSHYFDDMYKVHLGIIADPDDSEELVAVLLRGEEKHILVHPQTYVQVFDWAVRICKNK